DPRRPGHDHRVARTAEVTRNLLGPLEWRVHRLCPSGGEVIEMLGAAKLVDYLQVVLPLLDEAVEEEVFIDRALESSLGARPVVARDVDEECLVSARHLLHSIDDTTHVVVAV